MATAVDSFKQKAPFKREVHALAFLEKAFEKELGRVARSIRHTYINKIRSLKAEISQLRAQIAQSPSAPRLSTLPGHWHAKSRYAIGANTHTPKKQSNSATSPQPADTSRNSLSHVRKSPSEVPQSPSDVRNSPSDAGTLASDSLASVPQQPPVANTNPIERRSSDPDIFQEYLQNLKKCPNFFPKREESNIPQFTLKYRSNAHFNKLVEVIQSLIDNGELPEPTRIFQKTISKQIFYTLASPSDLSKYEAKRKFLEALKT